MGDVFTPQRTQITVERFQKMMATGVITPQDRIELIAGEMIDMAPIGGPHAWAVTQLATQLIRILGDRNVVWAQSPIVLSDRSQPQPDLCVLRRRDEGYGRALPTGGDVLLLVEVADTTLSFDRGKKLELYARQRIPEYWIVNLADKRLETYRQPGPAGYEVEFALKAGEDAVLALLPDVVVRLSEVLG